MQYRKYRNNPRELVAVGLLVAVATSGVVSGNLPPGGFAEADSQHMVSLYVDGQKRVFGSDATTVGELLNRSKIDLREGDSVEPVSSTVISDGFFNVNVYRARPVMVVDGYRSVRIKSASRSPRQIAEQAGLTVYPEDDYDQLAVTDIVSSEAIGDKVVVKRATSFAVKVDGTVKTVRTQAKTVGEALKESGIALGLNDTVSVPSDTVVTPDLSIGISRVSEVISTQTSSIARPVQTVPDPLMLKGQKSVRSEGSDGSQTVTYRIHYKDGIETSREMVALVSKTDPTPKVIVSGTKVMFAGSVEYWRPMVIAAAAQWNYDPNTMMRIMACESRGDATVVSRFIVNGEHPTGLFQYLPSTWRAAGGTDANILDGATQIQLTAKKMALYGTGPWECK